MTVFFLFARWHNCFSTVVSQKWGAIMNVCTESIWLCCYAGVICLFKIILHNCCLNKQFVFCSLNCIFFQVLHKHRHLLHGSRSIIPILSIGRPLPHPKIAPSRGGSGPPSNTWLLWTTLPHMPNGISIGPAVLLQYRPVTNSQTDHEHR